MNIKPNKIERFKAKLQPYLFLPEIAALDLENLDEEQRFYLRNFGIYNHKLSPETFMLRLRICAGRISLDQLGTIAYLAKKHSLHIIITARAQIELHGMNAGNVLDIRKKLEDSGIGTWQTLTDNFRNIVTDVFDGLGCENKIETYPLIKEMEALFLKNPDYIGTLPRKFNTAICGSSRSSHSFFGNDLYFALAEKNGIMGFNLYLGGKNSEMAKNADIFVLPKEVASLFEAVAKTYNRYGLRGTRSKTRLFHLLQHIGLEKFKIHMRHFYAGDFQHAGVCLIEKSPPNDITELRDGSYAFCYRSGFGEIGADELGKICEYATTNHLSVRLGVDQNLYLLGLKNRTLPFQNRKGSSCITVCAGSRYCDLALFDMKKEAAELPLKRLEKLNVTLGYSGCLKGCGRHQHVDIGLVGLRTGSLGPTQKSIRLFLGGEYTDGKRVARLILMAVPLHGLEHFIDTVLDEFEQSGYEDFEQFSKEVLNHFSADFLALWFLAKLYTGKKVLLKRYLHKSSTHCLEKEKAAIETAFGELALWSEHGVPFHAGINYLSQKIWNPNQKTEEQE